METMVRSKQWNTSDKRVEPSAGEDAGIGHIISSGCADLGK